MCRERPPFADEPARGIWRLWLRRVYDPKDSDNLGAVDWELSEEPLNRLSEASAIENVYPCRFIREMQRT